MAINKKDKCSTNRHVAYSGRKYCQCGEVVEPRYIGVKEKELFKQL